MIRTTEPTAKWRNRLGTIGIVAASTLLTILLCELGSRFVLNPVDFLSTVLVGDDILGVRVLAGSGGHDAWGFRNRSVPQTADVVALGDSHTYGNRAPMEDSWPSVLARLTGKRVYNLGMGGYGPNQYDYLLQTKALQLKPRVVICGLYLGDDFDNAFRITYGLSHWSALRREGFGPIDSNIWELPTSGDISWHQKLRQWLSEHSVLYQLVLHGAFQSMLGHYQIENESRFYDSSTSLILPEQHVEEAFFPAAVLRGLDQDSPTVQEGMRLTFQLLREMNAVCDQQGIQFIVAVIPTKEMVYARYLEHNPALAMHTTLDRVIAGERSARQKLFTALEEMNIRYVDTLPALEKASKTERIYIESGVDMHPSRNGYRVIAETLTPVL